MTMKAEELLSELKALAEARGLTDSALDSCQRSLEIARQDALEANVPFLEDRPLSELILKWRRHSLVFGHYVLGPFLETTVGIYVPDPSGVWFESMRPIGYYSLLTDLATGEIQDDVLELPDGPVSA